MGRSFFSDDFLHAINHEQLLGNQTLEPCALRFQVFKPTRLWHIHAAELVTPTEEGLFTDVVALAQVRVAREDLKDGQ